MTLPINEIICGDCVEVMDGWYERFGAFVQTCVTSPPYWGLRDYGIPPTKWPAISYLQSNRLGLRAPLHYGMSTAAIKAASTRLNSC